MNSKDMNKQSPKDLERGYSKPEFDDIESTLTRKPVDKDDLSTGTSNHNQRGHTFPYSGETD